MPMHASAVARMLCLALYLSAPLAVSAADQRLKVIVHPTRARRLTIAEVRAIFLKQQLLWDDGQPIVPVNRAAGSEAREGFSYAVFNQNSRRLAAYWNRRYYDAGEFPPATLASEEAVLRFVAANSNAIGYVTAPHTGDSVAVVLVLDAGDPRAISPPPESEELR